MSSHLSFLTPRELAERLRISPSTLERLIARGTLPIHRFGRQRRFSVEDVERWISSQRDPGWMNPRTPRGAFLKE